MQTEFFPRNFCSAKEMNSFEEFIGEDISEYPKTKEHRTKACPARDLRPPTTSK